MTVVRLRTPKVDFPWKAIAGIDELPGNWSKWLGGKGAYPQDEADGHNLARAAGGQKIRLNEANP